MSENTAVAKSAENARNEAALLPPTDVIEDAEGITLYADLPGTPRGADRLGSATIAVGASLDLPPPVDGQCRYQVTGVFRDGREATVEADLCTGQEFALQ